MKGILLISLLLLLAGQASANSYFKVVDISQIKVAQNSEANFTVIIRSAGGSGAFAEPIFKFNTTKGLSAEAPGGLRYIVATGSRILQLHYNGRGYCSRQLLPSGRRLCPGRALQLENCLRDCRSSQKGNQCVFECIFEQFSHDSVQRVRVSGKQNRPGKDTWTWSVNRNRSTLSCFQKGQILRLLRPYPTPVSLLL